MDEDKTRQPVGDEPTNDAAGTSESSNETSNDAPASETPQESSTDGEPMPTDSTESDVASTSAADSDSDHIDVKVGNPAEESAAEPSDDTPTSDANVSSADQPKSPVSDEAPMTDPPESGTPRDDIFAGASSSAATGQAVVGGKSSPRWLKLWLPLIVIIVLLAAAATYAFAVYLPNRPENVYKAGLKNTGLAIDHLIHQGEQQQPKHYPSVKLDGSLKYQSPDVSGDASLQGAFGSDGQGQLEVKADVGGKKFDANLLTNVVKGNDTPDVYVKVSGVKDTLNSMGGSDLAKLDSKWLLIDHTLIDSAQRRLQQSKSNGDTVVQPPTYQQIQDTINKVQKVNKDYLFTTDSAKAVLKKDKFIGKETKDGRTLYHYQVGYDKAHLKAYVGALAQALDASKLNSWSKQSSNKNLSEAMHIKGLQQRIDKADGKYKFDLWVDQKTKLVQSAKFVSPNDKSSVLTVSQNYTGGDTYPFSISVTGTEDGKPAEVSLGLSVNAKSNQVKLDLKFDQQSNSTTVTVHLGLTPSQDKVQITVPKDTKSITDLLEQTFSLGGDNTAAATTGAQADAERKSDIAVLNMKLSAYNTTTSRYPTLKQLNDSNWRQKYMDDVSSEVYQDPSGSSTTLAAKPAAKVYAYQPTGCDSQGCLSYKLTATLSNNKPYVQSDGNLETTPRDT